MLNRLWKRTKEVATMYTGIFVVVMILNQLLFFGFCLNPVCLIAAMPHVLFITVVIGTWLNKKNGWGNKATLSASLGAVPTIAKKAENGALIVEDTINQLARDQEARLAENKREREKQREIIERMQAQCTAKMSLDDKIEPSKNPKGAARSTLTLSSKVASSAVTGLNKASIDVPAVIDSASDDEVFVYDDDGYSKSLGEKIHTSNTINFNECTRENKHKNYASVNGYLEEPPARFDDEAEWLYDEAPPWLAGEDSPYMFDYDFKTIEEALQEYGVASLWHMTHRDNVKNIMGDGILSNTKAFANLSPVDISDHVVQRWRDSNDPIYGRKLHEYVPTYINIKNPMLYARREIQEELCLIEISLTALANDNFIFTDGNAAARNTKFYKLVGDLEKLPWEVLNACYWNNFEDGKRKRCAEVLIYRLIDPKHVSNIHCSSHKTLGYLSKLNIQSKITSELFFENRKAKPKSTPY